MAAISYKGGEILIETRINDNYKIEVRTKLSQNRPDVHTRPKINVQSFTIAKLIETIKLN